MSQLQGYWVSKSQLDSITYLNSVEKAVYLMRSLTQAGEYRFGGIGAMDKQANTAIRRLGQCTGIDDGKVSRKWDYAAMIVFAKSTMPSDIRLAEKCLRKYIFQEHLGYEQIDRKDAIRNANDDLIREFKNALKLFISN